MINLKNILNEQEDSSAKFEQNMIKYGYRDVWFGVNTSPTGVISLPDGQYTNMSTHRADFAIMLGKDGVDTGYAIWCSGLDGYGWRSNPIHTVTVSENGDRVEINTNDPDVKIQRIYLNDDKLAEYKKKLEKAKSNKPSVISGEKMLAKLKIAEMPENWSLLNAIQTYEDSVIEYLKDNKKVK